ncbi:MAG: PorT family protein [Bacteroidetes bacterium]|nr:PorT family protein [Bacteroidota bacterium]MBL6964578.1 PorT family protein [Bacteroidota bacterium]
MILLSLIVAPVLLSAQTRNLPRFDYGRKIHFGFTLGSSLANFKYEFSPRFYEEPSLLTVEMVRIPGITIGAITDVHFGEFFDLRTLPSLVLSSRSIHYNFVNNVTVTKSIESVFFELPVLVKYKSVRHGNVRFYVIGGGKVSWDFGSDAQAVRDPNNAIIAIKPLSYAYEFGCGFDMYFYFFKFSPEIKLSRGINNILDPYNDIYTGVFDKFYSNFIFFSFHFEG